MSVTCGDFTKVILKSKLEELLMYFETKMTFCYVKVLFIK